MGFRDMDLNDEVRSCLRKNKELGALGVDVVVRNGIVYLRGTVSRESRDSVLQLARSVESVQAVVDEMSDE